VEGGMKRTTTEESSPLAGAQLLNKTTKPGPLPSQRETIIISYQYPKWLRPGLCANRRRPSSPPMFTRLIRPCISWVALPLAPTTPATAAPPKSQATVSGTAINLAAIHATPAISAIRPEQVTKHHPVLRLCNPHRWALSGPPPDLDGSHYAAWRVIPMAPSVASARFSRWEAAALLNRPPGSDHRGTD